MPTPTTHPDADALLKAEVAVPAFFAKVAADTGIGRVDGEPAGRLLAVGDLVATAVDACVAKWAAAGMLDHADPVKTACDAALAAAGLLQAAAPAAPGYAAAPGVKAAAEAIAAARAAQVTPETPAAPAEVK